jgi:N utilization substance protein A
MSTYSIVSAIKQICNEKGIAYESVLETISAALAAAYRKDFGQKNQNIRVDFDPETGNMKAFDVKTVVLDELAAKFASEASVDKEILPEDEVFPFPVSEQEDMEEPRFNPKTDMSLSDARFIKPDAQEGDEIRIELVIPGDFGRMAAQTAKQVITQRFREAERETIFQQYKEKEHTVVMGAVQRIENYAIMVDLGRAIGLMPREYQVSRERYSIGQRLRFYIESVGIGSKGPEIIVSRTAKEIVKELFHTEIPEVANGAIEIKSIARDAGFRSKVAVYTEQENIDPIGSCVGQRGTRVQTIIAELSGEKIDIIEYSEDASEFIRNALLPSKVSDIHLNVEGKTALVRVDSDQLSLAIGRDGQNVRLAAKLTGWKISIVESEREPVVKDEGEEKEETVNPAKESPKGEETSGEEGIIQDPQ